MKTVLIPMLGYRIRPEYGIDFIFFNNYYCYTTIINLNIYPQGDGTPSINTSGGQK